MTNILEEQDKKFQEYIDKVSKATTQEEREKLEISHMSNIEIDEKATELESEKLNEAEEKKLSEEEESEKQNLKDLEASQKEEEKTEAEIREPINKKFEEIYTIRDSYKENNNKKLQKMYKKDVHIRYAEWLGLDTKGKELELIVRIKEFLQIK